MDPEVRAEFDEIRSILRETAALGRATDKRMDRAEKRAELADKRMDRAMERMDRAEKRMELAEKRMELAEKRMELAEKRMEKFDQQIQATRKLVVAGIKIVSQLAADTRELKRSQKAFLDSLRHARQRPPPHRVNCVRILGIESSCDETAAAVVEDGSRILASIVSSQIAIHARYGGVVPELASREHLRAIVPVVRLALEQSSTRLEDLAAIAVTQGPGLVGSLLVGITYAKALALTHTLPVIAVNHIEGHIHAVLSQNAVELPALALVVSGGHTHLYEVRDGFMYKLLGKTRDDAAGEAFDKVAKLLGFGYPGGPVIDALAPYGDPGAVRFTLAKMKGNPLDFSFSGLKTAVLRWVEARDLSAEVSARRALLASNPQPSTEEWLEVTPGATCGLLASFQRTVIEELLRRALASAEQIGARSLIISGGVACNSGLRIAANKSHLPYPVFFPEPGLSTDNAAMIAAAAFPKFMRGEFADATLRADANLALA